MVKDIRAGEIDIRAGEMDFHVHVVRGCGRINVQHRFVMRVVDEPADAICSYHACFGNLPLQIGGASDGRKIDMVEAMSKIGNYIELTTAWLRIRNRSEDESVIASATCQCISPAAADNDVTIYLIGAVNKRGDFRAHGERRR